MTFDTNLTVSFTTSGSTGSPVQWLRSEEQLQLECSIMRREIGEAEATLSFASPSHMFGDVFGRRIPKSMGIPSIHVGDILGSVNFPTVEHVFIVSVPSTWEVLIRQRSKLKQYKAVTFIHSAGPLPTIAARVLNALGSRSRLIEIFGSTECGGIAIRRNGALGQNQWTVLPDVELIGPAETGALEVASPRLATKVNNEQANTRVTDDIVWRTGSCSFVHLGRRDRIIKIDGLRVDLDSIDSQIEQRLRKFVASVPVQDGLRGTSFDVYVEGGDSLDELIVRRYSRFQPRGVYSRPELPRTHSGKVDYQYLSIDGTQVSRAIQ